MSPPVHPDPDARPRPFAQRLGLLCILLLLPMAAVALPTLVLTHFFGQRPPLKIPAAPAVDTSALRAELDGKANRLLPTPAPLTPDPVRVSVHDVSHVGPRAAKIMSQAHHLGGSAVEGLSDGGEQQHLFVDLPAGTADIFRRAVMENTPVESLPPAPTPNGARDQVEVFIRAAANDE